MSLILIFLRDSNHVLTIKLSKSNYPKKKKKIIMIYLKSHSVSDIANEKFKIQKSPSSTVELPRRKGNKNDIDGE